MVQRGATYPKRPRDLYRTPAAVTEALLDHVTFAPVILEPACGHGDLVQVVRRRGYLVHGSDIMPIGAPDAKVGDFLNGPVVFTPPFDIVTNPPGGLQGRKAVAFIQRALAITHPWQGRVAMLLGRDFDSAQKRVHLFRDCPAFAMTLVLLDRIVWFEPCTESPAVNHAWFIWDWTHRGPPVVRYTRVARHQGFYCDEERRAEYGWARKFNR
jgi:hypothetical protein